MANQSPPEDAGKGVKNSSCAGQKPITTRTLAGAVLVLLGAFAIGIGIREFRFKSAGQKQSAQAPKVVQPRDIPEIRQAPRGGEDVPALRPAGILPAERDKGKMPSPPEPPAPEPVSPPPTTTADTGGQSNTEARVEPAAEPVESAGGGFDEDPQLKERRGRVALGMIGYDPDADEVWIRIINDPSVSANARSNLIEDLNEDGLSYRNLTLDDLPVIEYRLELIADLLPYAMDEVNEDAFKEARKDLENMADRLSRQAGL
jgi:hypothetical protein